MNDSHMGANALNRKAPAPRNPFALAAAGAAAQHPERPENVAYLRDYFRSEDWRRRIAKPMGIRETLAANAGKSALLSGALPIINMAAVVRKEVEYLWQPYIPLHSLALLDGDPDVGKTWIATAIAAAVSRGGTLFGQANPMQPGRVLYLTRENDPERVLRPRLEDMGAKLENIDLVSIQVDFDKEGFAKLDATIAAGKYRFVVIDTLTTYTPKGTNTSSGVDVRHLCDPLQEIAGNRECNILAIRHLRKQEAKTALQAGAGSMQYAGTARSVLSAGIWYSEDGKEVRVLAHTKLNVGPKKGPSLAFHIGPAGRLEWDGVVNVTALQLVSSKPPKKQSRTDGARDFLKAFLAKGPEPTMVCIKEAEKTGIAKDTLVKAKKGLVVAFRKDDRWWWELEAQEAQKPQT